MARRQQVYTARVKRADDGAQDAKIKKKREDEPEDGAEPVWQQIYAGPQTMEFDNDALREFRRAKNMTQANVADAIGTSVRTYQKWESGETTPDGHYLLRLMNWLDIDSVQSLVKYIDPPDEG